MPSTLPGKQQMPWFRRWGMKYDLDSTRLVGVLTSPSTARIRMLQPWQWPWCLWCAMQIWSNHMKSGSFHVHSMGFFRGIQTDSLQVLALCSTDQHCQHRSSQDSFWRGPGSFSFFSQPSKFVQSSRDFCGSLRELLQILSCAVVHFREVMIVMQICQCLITVRCQDLPLINFGELMTEQFMAWTTNSAIYSRNGHLAVVNCLAELNYLRPNPFLCESTVLSHPFATFHLCNKHPFDFFTLFFFFTVFSFIFMCLDLSWDVSVASAEVRMPLSSPKQSQRGCWRTLSPGPATAQHGNFDDEMKSAVVKSWFDIFCENCEIDWHTNSSRESYTSYTF